MTIKPKKILLIHKNPQERESLAIMLSRFGHEVQFSYGNGSPDQMVKSHDLVIIDDELDGNSGLTFLSRLSRKLCEKVIYLASCPSVEASWELSNLPIYEKINKPVDSLKLAVVVCDYFVEVSKKRIALLS